MLSSKTDRRPLAVAGLGVLALSLLGTAATPSEPGFVADAGSIATFYKENVDGVLASQTLYFVATLFLLWFVGALYALLRRAEGPDGHTAVVALAGGVAGSAMLLAAGAANAVGALRADERGEIAPDVATVLWDLSAVLFGLAAPMGMAVLVLAVAVAALRNGALPRWFGVLSVPLGLALAIPPINHVAIIAFFFWVGIVGVVALTQGDPRAVTSPARTTSAEGVAA